MPPAAGEALALKLAGAEEVKVFVVEGEGGLTPGASHETRNTAWGLGLDNLVFLVDWNDFGIDDAAAVERRPRHARDWFERLRLARDRHRAGLRVGARDARGAGGGARREPGAASHRWPGSRRARAAATASTTTRATARRMADERARVLGRAQGVHGASTASSTQGVDEPAPTDAGERDAQARANFERRPERAARPTPTLVDWLTDRLVEVAATRSRTTSRASTSTDDGADIFKDERLYRRARTTRPRCGRSRARSSPTAPRSATWGAWVNAFAQAGVRPAAVHRRARPTWPSRPTSPASRKDFGEMPGWGWYERDTNPRGALLPQQITEFTQRRASSVGHRHRQPGRRPVRRLQRLLGRVLDLRLVLVPQVRPDAPLQPARAGLRAQGRQGALGRRPLRPRDGRGLAHPLRHLRDRRHAALPGGPRHRPAPVGVQRGAGRAGRGAGDRRRRSSRCT